MDFTKAHSLLIRRSLVAIGVSLVIVVTLFVSRVAKLSEYGSMALNDGAWGITCLAATLACFFAARQVSGRERVAWQLMSGGCGAWLAGHAVWTCYELVLGGLPEFPHWMQALFLCYPILFVCGLLTLPKPQGPAAFTPRHSGNLALIVSTLVVAFIVALLEPASSEARNPASNIVAAIHCTGLAAMFIAALFLLWSYRWQGMHWPLVFIVSGAGIHTATYVAYLHQMMTKTYQAASWFNVSWLFVFGAIACAGYERVWQAKFQPLEKPVALLPRERWLEAFIPAALIAIMLAVVWSYTEWITARVATYATAVGLVFVVILGMREVWIQRQEQRLLSALNTTNDSLLNANRELSKSEASYRTLSAELERRVADRTIALQQAYRELENFSYAVAHDLKAPLRSVDGFGSMLVAEYGERLDQKGRDYVERMRRSVLKMAQLIDDLLAYARVERREFQFARITLAPFIDDLLAEQRDDFERYGAKVTKQIAAVTVRADIEGLGMAIRNLLQNALKFSRNAQPPRIEVNVIAGDDGVLITVRDNGIGFDMNYHERIFEMFQRLHRAEEFPGTGIGLAIVRKGVERMSGRVWATSKPGDGATFHLLLPAGD